MAARTKVASTAPARKKPAPTIREVHAAVGQIVHEVSVVETLANAAATVAGKATPNDPTLPRRVFNLLVAVEVAARDALATAEALDREIGAAQPA